MLYIVILIIIIILSILSFQTYIKRPLKEEIILQSASKDGEENEFIDHRREFKDIGTSFVNNEFFIEEKSLFNFLNEINVEFKKGINNYISANKLGKYDIIFLFKGGNILRIITNEFFQEFPYESVKYLREYYKPYFKRSDADFSIYINPELKSREKIISDLSTIAYYIQVKLRKKFLLNPGKYFDYFNYSRTYQQGILDKYTELYQNAESLQNPENPIYYGKKVDDFLFLGGLHKEKYQGKVDTELKYNSKEQIVLSNITDKKLPLFISDNRTLDFIRQNDFVSFNLVRTKVNFNVIINGRNTNTDGELIDVSIPKDESVFKFYENLMSNVAQYTMKLEDKELIFFSYSLDYLMHDLEFILFNDEEFPWNVRKYTKRLNRLFLLYLTDMFIKLKDNDIRGKFLIKLYDILRIIRLNGVDPKMNSNILELMKINDKLNLRFNPLLSKIIELNRKGVDLDEFDEFIETIINNIKVSMTLFKGLDIFEENDGQIKYNYIYSGDITSLV